MGITPNTCHTAEPVARTGSRFRCAWVCLAFAARGCFLVRTSAVVVVLLFGLGACSSAEAPHAVFAGALRVEESVGEFDAQPTRGVVTVGGWHQLFDVDGNVVGAIAAGEDFRGRPCVLLVDGDAVVGSACVEDGLDSVVILSTDQIAAARVLDDRAESAVLGGNLMAIGPSRLLAFETDAGWTLRLADRDGRRLD